MIRTFWLKGTRFGGGVVVRERVSLVFGREGNLDSLVGQAVSSGTTIHLMIWFAGCYFAIASFDPEDPR